eukprot:658095-Prorocentrum_minimum.AAC.1
MAGGGIEAAGGGNGGRAPRGLRTQRGGTAPARPYHAGMATITYHTREESFDASHRTHVGRALVALRHVDKGLASDFASLAILTTDLSYAGSAGMFSQRTDRAPPPRRVWATSPAAWRRSSSLRAAGARWRGGVIGRRRWRGRRAPAWVWGTRTAAWGTSTRPASKRPPLVEPSPKVTQTALAPSGHSESRCSPETPLR